MKAISGRPSKTITLKTRLDCADNSGARKIELIAVKGFKTRKSMNPKAGIADLIIAVVKEGKPEIRSKIERAVIIRTKKEFRRANGTRLKFEDNAAVLVDEKGIPKGSEIKGPIPREIAERWPKLAGMATQLV